LNAVSLGFAAILLGVTVDYGLVLYQELKTHPADGAEGARAAAGRGIIWSAITTAAAFGSLALGSLPGLAELGALVAIGVLIGAVVMLRLLPGPLAAGETARAASAGGGQPEPFRSTPRFLSPGACLAACGVFAALLLVLGPDESAVAGLLDRLDGELEALRAAGEVEGHLLPRDIWPNATARAANADAARRIAARLP